jgi:hypothetical protein
MTESRHFPPPWSVDNPDMKLGQTCYIVRDANGHALAYVYFEDEPGRAIGGSPDDARRSTAHRGQHRQAAGAGAAAAIIIP